MSLAGSRIGYYLLVFSFISSDQTNITLNVGLINTHAYSICTITFSLPHNRLLSHGTRWKFATHGLVFDIHPLLYESCGCEPRTELENTLKKGPNKRKQKILWRQMDRRINLQKKYSVRFENCAPGGDESLRVKYKENTFAIITNKI